MKARIILARPGYLFSGFRHGSDLKLFCILQQIASTRRMRGLIFKALNLGSEYAAQADADEAMEDLTDSWLNLSMAPHC